LKNRNTGIPELGNCYFTVPSARVLVLGAIHRDMARPDDRRFGPGEQRQLEVLLVPVAKSPLGVLPCALVGVQRYHQSACINNLRIFK
jgi:hypothetical protein